MRLNQSLLLLHKCKQLQAHLITTGLFHSPFHRSKFFNQLLSSGDTTYALQIFRNFPSLVTNEWNTIIRALALTLHPSQAILFYRHGLRLLPCKPDALTCSFTLKACSRSLTSSEPLQLHSHAIRFGFLAGVFLQTTLLDAYAKSGSHLENACQVFDEIRPFRYVTAWNAIITGLAQGNRPVQALQLFKTMDRDLVPNEVTVIGALSACAQLGMVQEGDNVYHHYVKTHNLDMNEQVCNTVIDMFGKCGHVAKAYHVFNNMRCAKTIVTFNTMIMVLGINSEGTEALHVFNRLTHEGLRPDSVSYLSASSDS